MPILISIVTVVRNAKADLERTILSLRKQTYPNIEYIVVDGLSSDGTLEVIKNNLDHINAWISETDSSIYDAMNKGKDLATGDFVVFINAGDIFNTETVIADICNQMDSDLDKFYYGKVTIFNRDISWEYKPYDTRNNTNYLPHHQASFYPKSFYKQNSYDTSLFKLMGDIDYSMRVTRLYENVYIPVTTICSEMSGFSVLIYGSIKGIRLYIREFQYLIKKHPSFYSKNMTFEIYSKAIVKYIAFKIGGSYLINKMITKRLRAAGYTRN
jgi:putative colanic acid biosynthesis glycosyltransferase